ncbi:MAG: 3-dehydroquinate synthase, partial [Marivivens sp.]|nr:3-dehydroquinate synthase [Marivivens sp.]
MTFETVHVGLVGREYDVLIGPDLIATAGARVADMLTVKKVAIVTDENVARLHLATLQASLDAAGVAHSALTLPAGESTKRWPEFTKTVEWLLEQKVERNGLVIALGGG